MISPEKEGMSCKHSDTAKTAINVALGGAIWANLSAQQLQMTCLLGLRARGSAWDEQKGSAAFWNRPYVYSALQSPGNIGRAS
jgi:hypothetical protein